MRLRSKRLGAMARSPFEIELTEEEARELRSRAARYTTPHAEVLRAKIVLLAAAGETNAEIAAVLHVSIRTVEHHRSSIFQKLGIHSRAELVRYVSEHRLLPRT